MKRWEQRPFEIRTLFNPAFCGLILFRALQGFEEKDPRGMPFSLTLLILPLCLQKESREVIAASSRSYLLKITEKNPQIQVGFSGRTATMIPYAFEGFGLLMERGCISLSTDGRIQTVSGKVKKSVSGTQETKSCQHVARYLGKEFARIADRVTVYTAFGIRP